MTEKPTVIAVAKLYKGVAIYTTIEGYVVYSDSGEAIPCGTEADARKAIDDYIQALSRSMVMGEIPVQKRERRSCKGEQDRRQGENKHRGRSLVSPPIITLKLEVIC